MWYFGWLFIVICIIVFVGFVYDALTPSVRYGYFGNIHRRSGCVQDFINFSALLGLIFFPTWLALYLWDIHPDKMRMDVYSESSVVTDTMYIQSAALNSELSGTFYLGFGKINQVDVYKFYKVVNKDSYVLTEVPVEWTRIQEVDSLELGTPHVISYYYTEGLITHNKIVKAMLNRDDTESFQGLHHIKEHVIFVPKGTIVSDLNKLNLK